MTEEAATPHTTIQAVAHAGLDTLLLAAPFELCAYLHVGEELGPQLYLRRPTLATLDSAEAFQLFSSLRDLLEHDAAPTEQIAVGPFEAHVTRTIGPRSRGLWVIGSRSTPLTGEQIDVARSVGLSVMSVCHAAEALTGTPVVAREVVPTVTRVAVETLGAGIRAEVTVTRGGHERTGTREGTSALVAVASATLDAVESTRNVVAAAENGVGETRVVLVLTIDDDGVPAIGAALADGEPLGAAAAATLRSLAASG